MAAALVETSCRIFKFGGRRNSLPSHSGERPLPCRRMSVVTVTKEQEVVGYIVHHGKKMHLPQDRPVVFDKIGRRLLVLSSLGTVKIIIPLHHLMLLRVKVDRNAVSKLEVVWKEGKIVVNSFGSNEDAYKHYKELQKARIDALRIEEESKIDVPKYVRGPSRSSFNQPAKAEKGIGSRFLSSLNSRKTV